MDDELDVRRKKTNRQRLGKALLDHFGGDSFEDDIASLTGAAPDGIREAMVDALERGEMINAILVAEAAQEDRPGHCANAVCRDWIQSEGEESVKHSSGAVEIRQIGRLSFCGLGDAEACGCLFRMKEQPPNSLDGCEPIPEWAEAINMLRRAGLLKPDEFGRYDGTNFALHSNMRVVWWSLVDLLIENGRIEGSWVDDDMRDRGAESDQATRLLFPDPGQSHHGKN